MFFNDVFDGVFNDVFKGVFEVVFSLNGMFEGVLSLAGVFEGVFKGVFGLGVFDGALTLHVEFDIDDAVCLLYDDEDAVAACTLGLGVACTLLGEDLSPLGVACTSCNKAACTLLDDAARLDAACTLPGLPLDLRKSGCGAGRSRPSQ